jgi:alkane 1-monooxygenase
MSVHPSRFLPYPAFAAATLAPLALLMLAAGLGGARVWAALASVTVLGAAMDQLLPWVQSAPADDAEFPAADGLLVFLGLGALAMPCAVVLAVTGGVETAVQSGALCLAAGLWLGQIAHPAAHELIHRGDRRLFALGEAVYAAFLTGHHASAHRLVHHRHVATAQDPATARAGEGFWRFLPRAAIGGYRAGLRAENARRARVGAKGVHPYIRHAVTAAAALAVALWLGGGWGVALWLALAAHVQMQVHLSDYVQHYGLVRRPRADGRPEPVGAAHAWNAAHWFSAAQLLNAQRHSDHHAHPGRAYPALRLPDDAPRLPWPLPMACVIALVPPLWHRLMRRHLARLGR